MVAYQYSYVMKGLSKTYPGGREVLKDIWLSFLPGAKIGVLGANGAGKSTLLRIMAGDERDFAGEAWAAEGVRVGYLPQEPALDPTKDVFGNVIEGLAGTKALLDRFEAVSARFGEDLSEAEMDALIAEQGDLQEKIDQADAWDLDRTVEIAMDALRCPPADAEVTNLWPGCSAFSRITRGRS
jgi:ATPase subunit of ABC transporter with duplicated ATPase domains